MALQPAIRESNIADKHALRNRDKEIVNSSSDDEEYPKDRIGGQSLDDNSSYNEVKVVAERSPYLSASPQRRLLSNVKSASSLHMELHLNNLRNIAGL